MGFMKKAVCSLLVSLCAISTSVAADVSVKFEEGISVLAVNGKEVVNKRFFSGTDTVKLTDGFNQLLVQYTAEIKASADEYELESTDPFVLLFNSSNAQLVLKAPELKTGKDIKRFNAEGEWRLLSSQGSLIALKSSALKKEGFQLARNYEYELAEYNRTSGDAALPKRKGSDVFKTSKPLPAPIAMPEGGKEKSVSNTKEADVNMAEEMLRYWYNQADEETRKRFKAWINQ